MIRNKYAVLVVGATAATTLALGGAAVAATHPAADRPAVTYSISSSAKVTGPSTIAPGTVEVKLTGAKNQAELVKPKHGASKAKLIKDVAGVFKNPAPFESDFSAIGGSKTGHPFWTTLDRGTYYLIAVNGKLKPSDIKTIKVTGATQNTTAPKATVLTAMGAHMWAKSPTHMPSSGFVRLANHATQPHFIVLQRYKNSKTFADVKKVLAGKEKQKAVFVKGPGNSFDSLIASPGQIFETGYKLNPGKYVLTCFFPAPNGTPHAFLGMLRPMKVTK